MMVQNLSLEDRNFVERELEKKGRKKMIAYLFWLFLGGVGGHRYYLGDYGMAIAMTFTFGGLGIWSLIDVFFIGRRVDRINEEVERQALKDLDMMKKMTIASAVGVMQFPKQ